MTYYINPIWFYLMNLSDWLHFLFLFFGFTLVIIGITSVIVVYTDCFIEDTERKDRMKLPKMLIAAGIVSAFIAAFIPSEKTCVEMMIASQVTKENVSGTREEIYQIIDYVTDKLNGEEVEK